jgi:hypothetical protein
MAPFLQKVSKIQTPLSIALTPYTCTCDLPEGVWLHSRLLAANYGHVMLILVIAYYASVFIYPEMDDFSLFLEVFGMYMSVPALYGAVSAALVVGMAAVLAVISVWIPSYVSTALKFRSGEIKSLRDRDFQKYRVAIDLVTNIFGSSL